MKYRWLAWPDPKHGPNTVRPQTRWAGRQGDPGASRFYISLEDDLFIKYGIKDLIPSQLLENEQSEEINNKSIRREINQIQRIIEGQNLEIKKTPFRYSSFVEKQRKIMFEERDVFHDKSAALKFFASKPPNQSCKLLCNSESNTLKALSKKVLLYVIDKHWSQHLEEIAILRQGIHLRS
ncbi:hypothetical protein KKA14_07055, partial [bacterium]|nr:hypothetical protein [bacterium]